MAPGPQARVEASLLGRRRDGGTGVGGIHAVAHPQDALAEEGERTRAGEPQRDRGGTVGHGEGAHDPRGEEERDPHADEAGPPQDDEEGHRAAEGEERAGDHEPDDDARDLEDLVGEPLGLLGRVLRTEPPVDRVGEQQCGEVDPADRGHSSGDVPGEDRPAAGEVGEAEDGDRHEQVAPVVERGLEARGRGCPGRLTTSRSSPQVPGSTRTATIMKSAERQRTPPVVHRRIRSGLLRRSRMAHRPFVVEVLCRSAACPARRPDRQGQRSRRPGQPGMARARWEDAAR